MRTHRILFRQSLLLACFWGLSILTGWSTLARAQPTFSVDAQGPTVAGGFSEADLLVPGVPPVVAFPAAAYGFPCPPAMGCPAEVDAVSMGVDDTLNGLGVYRFALAFSVDEWAIGAPGVPAISATTEAAAAEASADVFLTAPLPLGMPVPPGAPGANFAIWDGDGLPAGVQALGLVEPNPAGAGIPDPGDNLDAMDLDVPPGPPVFFSLDAGFPDFLEGPPAPPNYGSAALQGFVGGDVLVGGAGPLAIWAPAAALGLDADGAVPDSDDVDAIIAWDNGDGIYQPVMGINSWQGGGTDMLVYSVRRGSAVIGGIDVLLGLPIEEGDVLIPVFDPVDGVPMFDALEGDWDPGILVAAESLGLATLRSGLGVADDVDALDWSGLVDPGFFFGDGFETGDTSGWSSTTP